MTKNVKIKNMNSYKRMGLFMLISAIGGGALGLLGATILANGGVNTVEGGVSYVLEGIQSIMVPALAVIMLASVVYGEINLKKQRMICSKILETEDEECDQWEYEEEKTGAYGTIANLISQVLCILVISAGYSMKYISGNIARMLAACLIFLACYTYDGFWQIRYVKQVQKAYPEKKGDPSSGKFRQQWLDSCDEAEKEVIYRSAYKSYLCTNKTIPALLLITMLGHLFFNTGIMAIVTVAFIWLVVAVSYLRTCVKLKGKKIRE